MHTGLHGEFFPMSIVFVIPGLLLLMVVRRRTKLSLYITNIAEGERSLYVRPMKRDVCRRCPSGWPVAG